MLIEAVYATIGDPKRWDDFLNLLAGFVPYDSAGIQIYDTKRHTSAIDTQIGLDPAALTAYQAYYCTINPWMRHPRALQPDVILTSEVLLSPEEYRRTEFCHDFGAPNHMEHTIGCKLSNDENVNAYLSLHRRAAYGPYGDADEAILKALMPHLQRAARLSGRLSQLESLHQALLQSAGPLFTVDADLRLFETNAEGEDLLRSGLLFSVTNGLLCARDANREALVRLATGTADTEFLKDSSGQDYLVKAIPASPKWLLSA